ncbi:TraI/MobA(P) family conjugative relaxase [Desulforhopalus singaporensis]|uniref:Relaxase/Mobilisation nuclease domain-containing protein n=1 Tax=Desulforhopalus singaporensis TaxID=91360 RepID=A0A1H0S1Y3_9BACT|nr:TraI/MobA(P) family conjugative relaxase [Desulforhopalus singaporensis]SDP35714.1 Relaxase/Mobilisation nuclease domain-containing protein [Desulforhopalus singaporensis]
MISKRIPCEPQNDNFKRLAEYIAAAKHEIATEKNNYEHIGNFNNQPHTGKPGPLSGNKLRKLSECGLACNAGRRAKDILSLDARSYRRKTKGLRRGDDVGSNEKCLDKWTAGCYSDQDYNLAINEIRATQAMNARTKKEKTYHMVVSIHPEDMEKLSIADFRDIEKEFAKALGFEDHQRVCGIHVNTDNPHLHIAYNMIHKEKYTRHDPWYDYKKRNEVCRALEKKYDITIDKGDEQQFTDYLKRRQGDITLAFEGARNWQELHEDLATFGLAVHLRGNGCILAAIGQMHKDDHRTKLSDFDRNFTKKKLEDRFGKFEKSAGGYDVKEFFRREPKRENHQASKFENQTGLKSFDTYLMESKDFIASAADHTGAWQEFHKVLAMIGLEIAPRGNGHVLKDIGGRTKGKNAAPFSKTGLRITKLQKKFGLFEPSTGNYKVEKSYKYQPVNPLKSAKEREAWKVYIRNKKRSPNLNWRKFKKNLQQFFEEEYER